MRFLMVILLAASAAFADEPVRYAKPELLVDLTSLSELWLDEESPVVVLDVRAQAEFQTRRLPTARHVDVREWMAAFGDGRDASSWSKRIGALGIGDGATVVVYDRFTSPTATRVWWILKYWGVEDACVLDGGFRDQPLPTTEVIPNPPMPTEFVAKPHPDRLATHDEVLRAIATEGEARSCLIDTRSDAEVAAGVIPSAGHSDWSRYIDPQTGKMRSALELKTLLQQVGFTVERPAIAYCRTGGRASVVAFAMELMGGEKVANYYGSWNDWSRQPNAPIGRPNVEAAR